MATITSTSTFLGFLRNYWLMKGVPRELWQNAGTWWKDLRKGINSDWSGDGIMNFPTSTNLPGNTSSDYEIAFANASPTTGNKWQVTDAQLWNVMQIGWRVTELSSSKRNAYFQNKFYESNGHVKRFATTMSWKVWGDTGGAMSKLDGTSAVNTSTLTMLNRATVRRFEGENENNEGGDFLVFGPNRDGTSIRPGRLKVQTVNEESGLITVDATDPTQVILGLLNTDFVFMEGDPGKSFAGFFTWIPLSSADLVSGSGTETLFGVDRSKRPDRLGGRRITFSSGASPYSIISGICQRAIDVNAPIDRLYVPTKEMDRIVRDLRPERALDPVTVKATPGSMRGGFTAYRFVWPGLDEPVLLMADKWLNNIEVTEDNDQLYIGLTSSDWMFDTYTSGISWKDYTGSVLEEMPGSQSFYAKYGAFGQLINTGPGRNIISGPVGTVVP